MTAVSSSPLASAPERRWLQFRLRTLLLIPLLLGLFCAFAGQAYDHFLLLEAFYGAVLGTFWAIGRMQIVGLHSQGLRRVLPVVWAAVCGGLTTGILVGPINLMIALSRTYPNWTIDWQGAWQPMEILSAAVAGIGLGALFGAAGAALVGPSAAYVAQFRLERRVPWAAGNADKSPSPALTGATQPREITASRKRWLTRLACNLPCALVLALPAAWLGYQVRLYYREHSALGEWRRAGIRVEASSSYEGPQWVRRLYPEEFRTKWFRRVSMVSLSGPLSAAGCRPLEELTELGYVSIRAEEMDDADEVLHALAGLRNSRFVLLSLDLSGSDVTSAGTQHLRRLARLTELHLDRTTITDADLANLRGLTVLNSLSVQETSLTGEGFKHLAQSRLRTIDLSGTQVGDAGLAHLKGMSSLERLDLGGTAVTDAGLAHLRALPLGSLRLPNTAITDAAAADLSRMTSLWDLDLSNTAITDATLSRLPAMVRLHRLTLDGTQVTDQGMAHLQGLALLKELSVRGTVVTKAGVSRLEEANPELRIQW